MVKITIEEHPLAKKRTAGNIDPFPGLTMEVSNYSFQATISSGFSPYPKDTPTITKTALVERILDGYAVLSVHTDDVSRWGWGGAGRTGDSSSRTEPFGIEPISNPAQVDRRLYNRILKEIQELRAKGYQFEIEDKTKYAVRMVQT
ncbi:MAG: hypothetical protein AABX12_03190 [Nanoarchaeota archaeon]